jgi:hypothetical protein
LLKLLRREDGIRASYEPPPVAAFPFCPRAFPETSPTMIGTSRTEYYFIQVCIIGLHYLAPLCILYCLLVVGFYGFKATRYPVPLAIECLALAETLFFLLVYLPYRKYLQREAVHPPPLSKEDRRELFDLCNDNIPDHEEYLEKWFLGARSEDIKRENVKEFFLWAFFDRGGPPGNDDEELEEMLKATEAHLGRKIEPGRGSAKCLRLTLDNAEMLHRSLVWYFVSCSLSHTIPNLTAVLVCRVC